MRRRRQNRIQYFKRHIDLFISVLMYYKSNFRQARHFYSRAPLCVVRTRTLLSVFCYHIFSVSGEMSKEHLMSYLRQSHLHFPNEC